jgi:hypothetical protein
VGGALRCVRSVEYAGRRDRAGGRPAARGARASGRRAGAGRGARSPSPAVNACAGAPALDEFDFVLGGGIVPGAWCSWAASPASARARCCCRSRRDSTGGGASHAVRVGRRIAAAGALRAERLAEDASATCRCHRDVAGVDPGHAAEPDPTMRVPLRHRRLHPDGAHRTARRRTGQRGAGARVRRAPHALCEGHATWRCS